MEIKTAVVKNWRDKFLEDLIAEDYIAIGSTDFLTEKDVRTAMKAIQDAEANRDEDEERKHIRKLQRERANRLFGSCI
jgi:hypothetical protein